MVTVSDMVRRAGTARRRGVTHRRMVAAASTAAAGALLLAACGSSAGHRTASASSNTPAGRTATARANAPRATAGPATTATPSGSASTGSSTGGTAACTTSSLSVTVNTAQAGAAAGSTYVPLDFMNASHTPCTLYGFPGVSFVTSPGGAQIGAAAARITGYRSVTATLPPGGYAHAWLQVTDAGNYPASDCTPVTAHVLRVYPPNNTTPAYVDHDFRACSSTTARILSVMPVRPGPGVRGQVP